MSVSVSLSVCSSFYLGFLISGVGRVGGKGRGSGGAVSFQRWVGGGGNYFLRTSFLPIDPGGLMFKVGRGCLLCHILEMGGAGWG